MPATVTASYTLSAIDSAHLHFSWISDGGEVGPEADILLQLVADAVDARLSGTFEMRSSGTSSMQMRSRSSA